MSNARSIEVLAMDSVARPAMERALRARGVEWASAAHVSATSSIAGAIEREGVPAIAIARLIDLVVVPGYPEAYRIATTSYPAPELLATDPVAYRGGRRLWEHKVGGARMRISIEFDEALRRYRSQPGVNREIAAALYAARKQFQVTINTLTMAGVNPAEVLPKTAVGREGVMAWRAVENDLPVLASMRSDLWVDPKDIEPDGTAHGRDVRTRVLAALEQVFGPTGGPRVLVHHGFYFYTPPQWAFFNLLAAVGDVRQIFITHDDGKSPVFEIWRRFFQERWRMPRADRVLTGITPTSAARALLDGLGGRRVDAASVAGSLDLLRCHTAADLVRSLNADRGPRIPDGSRRLPRVFAADDQSVERLVGRLGGTSEDDDVNLARLPIGAFLLRIHECLRAGVHGGVRLSLTPDALLDIASSGYVVLPAQASSEALRALRRAIPFFRDCDHPDDWDTRADHLRALIATDVQSIRGTTQSATDAERIANVLENPLRTVPWADIDVDQAELVRHTIRATTSLLRQFSADQRVHLKNHMDKLATLLRGGLARLPLNEQAMLEARLEGMGAGLAQEIDADGLPDVVAMLLGRTIDFDGAGDDAKRSGIAPLRALTMLGYERTTQPLHVANLSDGVFPSKVRSVGWPFSSAEIAEATHPVAEQLLAALDETSSLGDLYILWLALDGVEGARVTLSWIEEVGGESRSPSAVLSLLTSHSDPALAEVMGGVLARLESGDGPDAVEPSPLDLDDARTTDQAIESAAAGFDRRALASAIVCPRRFALQWAMGPSSSFSADHHQRILFGNVEGVLLKQRRFADDWVRRLCGDLWRFLTVGERESSRAFRVFVPNGGGALPAWLLTLNGSRSGNDLLSQAYQFASSDTMPLDQVTSHIAVSGDVLPRRPDSVTSEQCSLCPVRSRCSDASYVE